LAELEQKRLEEAGEWETLKSTYADKERSAVEAVRNELAPQLQQTQSKLKEIMIDRAIAEEAAKQEAFPASISQFTKLAREYASMGDDLNVTIAEGRGNNIAELVTNLKGTDEFGVFFKADVATGSGGSTQNKGGQPGGAVKKASEMTTQEKSKFITDNGLDAWKAHMAKG
jgi:hypothetical protein